jgi:hypothetical protein
LQGLGCRLVCGSSRRIQLGGDRDAGGCWLIPAQNSGRR